MLVDLNIIIAMLVINKRLEWDVTFNGEKPNTKSVFKSMSSHKQEQRQQ